MIGEPTMMRPRHSHMGKLAYRDRVHATAAHSSLSHSKPSAIAAAARLLAVLDELQRQHRPTGEPEVTFNCGTISGGTALNVIAERVHVHIRDPSHGRPRPRRHAATLHVAPWTASEPRWPNTVARSMSPRSPAIRRFAPPRMIRGCDVVERIADAGPATSIGYGTEGGLFAEALDASVVICGPGDIAVAHRPDEYVTVDQLLRCERFFCALVQQICVDPVVEG